MEGSTETDDTDFVCNRCQRPFYFIRDSGVYFNEQGKQIDPASDRRGGGIMQPALPACADDNHPVPAVPILGELKELFTYE